MTDLERLREGVLRDLDQKVNEAIAAPTNEYLLGNLHGRMIAFALADIISKDEFDSYHDRLEDGGLPSTRLRL